MKFAPAADSGAARRWQDLLWCEWKALETVRQAGVPAAPARCVDVGGWRFLEVERFDRVGERGRSAVVRLGTLDDERLGARPFSLPAGDASRLRWLDAFGQLIGNTDRHFGNVTFFVLADGSLRLAPAYDMLPMVLAPARETVVTRAFEPAAPIGDNLDVWGDAAAWAQRYWREIEGHPALEPEVRAFAARAGAAVAALAARVTPGSV